jgi:hypothetical protein
MPLHKKHGNGGIGQQQVAELGDFGDMLILTIKEEHGFGLTTKQLETAPTFEHFDH